ncbi:MAG: hypothetical protein IMZ59_02135 [Actinobacteria bacterium]|nr:hypothetical protein [Actinomycetota bacterium]
MNELPTKQDLEDFKQQLQERLDLLKEELIKIKTEQEETITPKSEIELAMKAKDEVIENLRNYNGIVKKFAEERIPLTTETRNLSDDEFTEIVTNENGIDGYSFRVVKKSLPEKQQVDMDIEVKNGVVSRRH